MESTAGTVSAQSEKVESLERENRALKAALEERDAALQDARATLVRSAAYNKRVYQDAPVPIVIIDPAIGIVDCNQAAVRDAIRRHRYADGGRGDHTHHLRARYCQFFMACAACEWRDLRCRGQSHGLRLRRTHSAALHGG